MIHKIQLADLRIEELIQFLPQLRAQFDGAGSLPPRITALLAELSAVEQDIDRLYKRDTARALTEKAVEQDAVRDRRVSGCFQYVAVHADDPDAALAEAAASIQPVLEKYGSSTTITKAGLNAETAIVSNLLADLARPELASAVAALRLERWLTALREANDAVNATLLERAALNAGQELPFRLKEKRLEARRAYSRLLEKCVHFAEESDHAAPWPGLVTRINTITADYDRLIAGRKGRAAAKAETAPAAS